MRAAVYSRKGVAREVLSVVELPDPQPGAGEVRVRISFSAVNPTDWKMRVSEAPMVGPQQTPNQDGSGVIDSVGDGVDPARVGQSVWVFHAAWQRVGGTAAEFVVLPEAQAVPVPDGVDLSFAGALGIPFITAHGCLYSDGPVEGRTILVAGGAGAVGNAAIQLAVHGGARVIATVSSDEKGRLATAAGAHVVVNYRDADAAQQIRAAAPGGVSRIIEVALGANRELDLAVLAPHGVVVTYANELTDPDIPVRTLMTMNATLRFALVYVFTPDQISAATRGITEALEAGALTSLLPEHRFTLDQIAEAHEAVESDVVGKVLIEL